MFIFNDGIDVHQEINGSGTKAKRIQKLRWE